MVRFAPPPDALRATTLKVTVCEAPAELAPGSVEWTSFCNAVAREAPDLLLLNEMPFWISSGASFAESFAESDCQRSLDLHAEGPAPLDQLGAKAVAGSRPCWLDGRRVNEAFVWTRGIGLRGVHTKQYFPNEEGYSNRVGFRAGLRHFSATDAAGAQRGVLICTELMFNERARRYGRGGVDALLVPRAVGGGSLRRWLVAARMAAIVSGAYVLSSNRAGADSKGQAFGGAGWIIDPSGDLVAETSPAEPLAVLRIDTAAGRRAQTEYPCYVEE